MPTNETASQRALIVALVTFLFGAVLCAYFDVDTPHLAGTPACQNQN